MQLFPAIDIKDHKVVRLLHGDYEKVTVYEQTPLEAAQTFFHAGAGNLHIVDLDGAKDGSLANFQAIKSVLEQTNMFVEVGGGIRTLERIKKYLDIGVSRVILGTAALENPPFLKEALRTYGTHVAVGVDAADGRVATHGWLNVSDIDSFDFCIQMRDLSVKNIIYTDIAKDGALSGTNMKIYRQLRTIDDLDITASGGITYYEELEELSRMGIYGAILGKALYSGTLDLKEALRRTGGTQCLQNE